MQKKPNPRISAIENTKLDLVYNITSKIARYFKDMMASKLPSSRITFKDLTLISDSLDLLDKFNVGTNKYLGFYQFFCNEYDPIFKDLDIYNKVRAKINIHKVFLSEGLELKGNTKQHSTIILEIVIREFERKIKDLNSLIRKIDGFVVFKRNAKLDFNFILPGDASADAMTVGMHVKFYEEKIFKLKSKLAENLK